MLAREAIQKGQVTAAATGGGGTFDDIREIADFAVLNKLGKALSLAGALSMEEARAFYWLLLRAPTEAGLKQIQPILVNIPQPHTPLTKDAAGTVQKVDPYPKKDEITMLLGTLSPELRNRFKADIDALAAKPPGTKMAPFTSVQTNQSDSTARVSVGIK
jgi:hypothetical protein